MSGKCHGVGASGGRRPTATTLHGASHARTRAGTQVARTACFAKSASSALCAQLICIDAIGASLPRRCARVSQNKIQEIPLRAAQRLRMSARRRATFLDSRLVVEDHDERVLVSLGMRGERKMSSSGRRYSENNGEMKHTNIMAHATLRRKTSQWCAAQWQSQLTNAIPSYRCGQRTATVPAKFVLLHTRAEKNIDNRIECYLERHRQH